MFRSACRRRWAALLLVLLTLLLGSPARAAVYGFGVVSNDKYINLRSQPTQNSTKLGSYNKGVWIEIVGESGNWYAVNCPDGKSGWMSKNFLDMGSDVSRTVGIVTNPRERGYLNLRESASYNARVIDYYYNGVPCTLLGLYNGWYLVRVDGVVGYFRQEYIRQMTRVASDEVATVQTPNNTGLNLRAGPGTQYTSIRQFKGGTYVMVLQKGNGWWKVSVDGYVGYMNTSFLKEGIVKPNFSSAGSKDGIGTALVSNPRANQVLNLRESASVTSRVISQHGNGTRVTVLAQGMEWCKVRINATGDEGYMMTDYLSLQNMPTIPTMVVSHPKKSYVNLRSTPSLSGNQILARMPHGATVTVLIPGDVWVKVRYNGQTGYAAKYFLN